MPQVRAKQRHDQRKQQNRSVNPYFVDARQSRGGDRNKRLETPIEVAEAFSRFTVVRSAPENRSAETSAVTDQFLDSVESIHEAPLIRRPPRTNAAQKLFAWLRRIFASGAVRPARS